MPFHRATMLLLCILLVLPLACGSDEGPVQTSGNGGPVIDDALLTLFPDVNGDGSPDILHIGARGTSMIPFVLVNKGHDEFAMVTDAYDVINGNSQTFAYSPFARVFDLTGETIWFYLSVVPARMQKTGRIRRGLTRAIRKRQSGVAEPRKSWGTRKPWVCRLDSVCRRRFSLSTMDQGRRIRR